jgi:Tfp pilus assembly protein PilN
VAVYEGARPQSILLPRRRSRAVDAPTLPRRRMRGAVRARRRRTNRLSILLGGIVVAFMLAFFSLAQSVRVAATGYDINRLLDERQSLLDRKQELLSDLNRLGSEPAIRQQALEAGLGQLTDPLVLTGR